MSQHLPSGYARIFSKIRFLSPLRNPTRNSAWLQYTYRIEKIHTNILSLLFYMVEKKLTHSFSQVDKDKVVFQANKHCCQTEDKIQFSPQLQSSD